MAPADSSAQVDRAERVAAAFGKRVVWVEGLKGDGLSHSGVDRNVIFLNPDSGRSVQVLVAHELVSN